MGVFLRGNNDNNYHNSSSNYNSYKSNNNNSNDKVIKVTTMVIIPILVQTQILGSIRNKKDEIRVNTEKNMN